MLGWHGVSVSRQVFADSDSIRPLTSGRHHP
jgi:hypothetical protein